MPSREPDLQRNVNSGGRIEREYGPTAMLLLAAAAAIMTMTACSPVTPAPAMPSGEGGAEPPVTPTPDPTPPPSQETEKKTWTLDAAAFGDDGGSIWAETSNRSAPFAWDAITADNAAAVRVSIEGRTLPFQNRSWQPLFDSDFSGAEWAAAAEVSAGQVVLVLTAEDQSFNEVARVALTNGGSGYTSAPAVVFSGGGGGSGAAATATLTVDVVGSVSVTAGSGYTTAPAVTFPAAAAAAAARPPLRRWRLAAYSR